MITDKKTANAIGGKTARACESCLKKRARWFCPADDAFLCQACDSTVHLANELAGRHKRVRLEGASCKPPHVDTCTTYTEQNSNNHKTTHNSHDNKTCLSSPSWHQGFTKKARTPRHGKRGKPSDETKLNPIMPEVPDMSSDHEGLAEENEENMVFCVPTFEPFEAELDNNTSGIVEDDEFNISLIGFDGEGGEHEWDNLPGFDLPSDNDLAEFAADVENLLEQEPDDHDIYVASPLVDKETVSNRPLEKTLVKKMECLLEEVIKGEDDDRDKDLELGISLPRKAGVKVEDERGSTTECDHEFEWSIDVASDILMGFEVNCSSSQLNGVEAVEDYDKESMGREGEGNGQAKEKRKRFLSLNYEGVIKAWTGPSPWTTGHRPEFNLHHDGWPNCMGVLGLTETQHQCGDHMMGGRGVNVDGGGGREARVSRYREKRRTRLFSKKIRYEVRKLNAEKRPRLKGRFVKRTPLAPFVGVGPTTYSHMMNK